jgi:hypothetical protein
MSTDLKTALPPHDASRPNTEQGLYEKYRVSRTDGSSEPGGKHHGCNHFVLDVDHDPHATAALIAYAAAIESTHPALAADMRRQYRLAAPARQVVPVATVPEALLKALRFYANGSHYHVDMNEFDTVSGEPQNWWASERDDDETMFEDGTIAKRALQGIAVSWIDGGNDDSPPMVDGEVFAAGAAPIPTDWQPIETAPRGVTVLLWGPDFKRPHVGDWADYRVYNAPGYTRWALLHEAPKP